MPARAAHAWTDLEAIVRVDGLDEAVSVLHITDSHISRGPETEAPYAACSARMHAACPEHDASFAFRAQLDLAARRRVDLLALTGDQVNYPGAAAVTWVADALRRAGVPYVYTAGNHDWHYEGLPGSSAALRRDWRVRRLAPLYAGDPAHAALEIGGLLFVAIDNSTYQVDDEQLAFFRAQAARGLPLVLLCHVPLALPALRTGGHPLCGDPAWGAATDRNWRLERRPPWPESGNLPSTTAFYEAAVSSPALVAVLCGHIHADRVETIRDGAVQYATRAGMDGSCRLLRFVPPSFRGDP